MNIFVTDLDPVKSAQALDDKRVRHMPKECVELLGIYIHAATGKWYIDFPLWDKHLRNEPNFLYNHPVSRWVRRDKRNMSWLVRHLIGLFDEFQFRFEAEHNLVPIYKELRDVIGGLVEGQPYTFYNSSLYKELPIVEAYRRTMVKKWYETDAVKPVKWTKRNAPSWLSELGTQTQLDLPTQNQIHGV